MRPELADVGRLQVAAMGAEHGVKAVRRGKNDFRDHFAALIDELVCQQVLNVVGEFAELPVSASGGIALERVHRAPDASQRLRVRRVGFEEDAGLIQLLQDVLRALKKEFAKFRGAFIGEKVHSPASIRW
jgi:hypothetical protein